MATSRVGLISQNTLTATAGFLAWNWLYAYCVLSTRTPKQIYGIDNQASPRQDLKKFGEAAVKEGKLTRRQLELIQRMEGAGANSIEGFIFFAASLLFGLIAGIPHENLVRGATVYTIARIAYGIAYVGIETNVAASVRGLIWWVCNCSCFYLLWRSVWHA